MDKKLENEPVRINLGRLDEFAKMPDIPPGSTVTVRVVNRYPRPEEAMPPGPAEPDKK